MKLFLFNNNEKLIGTVTPLEAVQDEELNKIITLEATTMYSSLVENASYIGHKNYKNQSMFHLYKIDHINKTSTTDVKIVAVDSFFDDMESDGYIKDYRPKGKSVMNILQVILEGSRWKLGEVRATNLVSTNFYYVTRKEAISKLIEATGVEIRPRIEFSRGKIINRYLDVYPRLGSDYGKVFIHGKDLLTVSEKKSQGAIYTAAVGRGKGEEVTDDNGEATGGYGRRITFKDVVWSKRGGNPVDKPKGQEYVEIPELTKIYGFEEGTKPRVKIVEFQDEEDPANLLRLTYEWLEKNSRMQVEYSATVLNVGNCDLGDTVGIYNPTIGIKYKTRVFKVKRNLIDNSLTEFGIGDKVISSPFSRTIELAKDIKNLEDNTVYWLDKIREKLSDSFLTEDGYNYDLKTDNEYNLPAGLYSFDKPIDQNPTKVVYVGAGKIAIAKSKKPNGEWDWKTFLDGSGATLDLMNAGTLRAGIITSADGSSYWNLDTGELHLSQSAVSEVTTSEVNKIFNARKDELKGDPGRPGANGRDGRDGAPGKNGVDGRPGKDGVDSYIHRKYSRNANGNPMSDDSNLDFIGIYTGRSATPPTNANQYTWSRIKGRDGANGVPGAKGADGRTSYFHTAYANSQDGRQGFSTTDGFNKIYVGTYSDFTEADSNDPTKYTWTKIKGDDGRDGINGRNGDSFARNYLAGTAEEKIFTAVNDNFVTQEAFKLVDNKTIRDLGFKLGEKVTFACDYEVLYNGAVKKIDTLNFEWYDTNQYRVWMDSISTPTKGELIRTIAVTNDLLDCTRLYLRCDRVNARIRINNARIIKGDKVEPWTIAQEDLRGESNYIHRKYSNNANGSGMSDNYNQNYIGIYTGFSKTPPTNPNEYTWSRIKGQDGSNGAPGARGADGRTSYLHTAYANSADGRRDFSTTDSNREYLGTYSDFTEADSTDPNKYSWTKVKGAQGVTPNPNLLLNTEIKSLEGINKTASQPNNIKINPNDYNGHNSLEWKETALSSPQWRGFLFSSNVKKFKKGDKIVVRVPVYIFSDVNLTGSSFYFEMKNYATNTSFPFNLGEGTPTNKWVVKEFKLTVDRDFEFSSNDWAFFWLYTNGHVKIAEPYVGYGDEVPGAWSPAIEDLQGHSLTANLRFEGTYINNVTNNVKVFVDVFYDGQKITDGFNVKWKYNGGNRTTWNTMQSAIVNNDGHIPAIYWGNGTQNGTPLECIVSVSYKGLNAIASGRMDNMPDVVEIKETIKKYKTFDSTLEQFTSVIGEIDTKIFTKDYAKNNLNAEDVEKTGNDVYYNVKGKLEKGKTYTIFANLDNVPDNQEVKIYGTSGDENKKVVSNGLNYWVATYGNDETKVNFYPLGKDTKISNVKIFEGDLRTEDLGENLYDSSKPIVYDYYRTEGNYGVIAIPSKEVIEAGNSYEINFDAENPNGTWDMNFRAGWTPEMLENIYLKKISEIKKNITLKIKAKGNRIVFRAGTYMPNGNMMFGIFYIANTPINKITNIRVYKRPNYALGYAENSEIYNINSKISQTKHELNLSVTENISKFSNALNAKNLYKSQRWQKNGTDIYFDTTETLKKNTKYNVYFKLIGVLAEDKGKKARVYNSVSPGTTSITLDDKEYEFTVYYNSDRTNINIDQLPHGVINIKNIKIYEENSSGYNIETPLSYLKSEIDILKNRIALTVDDSSNAKSEIELLKDRIKQSVTVGEFGTQLLQNQYSLRVAWNNISNYVQFENGGLTIYNGTKSENQKRSRFDENGSWYYRDGYTVGNIGTNVYKDDNSKKGLVFDLEPDGAYMTWSAKSYKGEDSYKMKWTYSNKTTGFYTAGQLHAGCDIDMHWNYLRNVNVDLETFGTGGFTGNVRIVHSIEKVGTNGGFKWSYGSMTFKRGILVSTSV